MILVSPPCRSAGGPSQSGAASRPTWPDKLAQVAVAVLGLPAVYLVTQGGDGARWGVLCGLASQPFWCLATWRGRQWGMLALSLAYLAVWARAVWRLWL